MPSSTARGADPASEEEFLSSLYKGGELLAAGKVVEARNHLEKANQLAPKNEKAQNLLGLTYFKLGLFDEASTVYERLVRENPADPTLRVNLGLVYLKTNNLERCVKEFETATDLEPTHKKAHNYLGLALAQAGEYARARDHFVQAGSDAMAEKMEKALVTKAEAASPPKPMTVKLGQAPLAPPPEVIHESPPPLPSAAKADEAPIEVMSDSDVSEEPAEETPLETPPPRPSQDWGVQAEISTETSAPPQSELDTNGTAAPDGPSWTAVAEAQMIHVEAPIEPLSVETEPIEPLPDDVATSGDLPLLDADAAVVSVETGEAAPDDLSTPPNPATEEDWSSVAADGSGERRSQPEGVEAPPAMMEAVEPVDAAPPSAEPVLDAPSGDAPTTPEWMVSPEPSGASASSPRWTAMAARIAANADFAAEPAWVTQPIDGATEPVTAPENEVSSGGYDVSTTEYDSGIQPADGGPAAYDPAAGADPSAAGYDASGGYDAPPEGMASYDTAYQSQPMESYAATTEAYSGYDSAIDPSAGYEPGQPMAVEGEQQGELSGDAGQTASTAQQQQDYAAGYDTAYSTPEYPTPLDTPSTTRDDQSSVPTYEPAAVPAEAHVDLPLEPGAQGAHPLEHVAVKPHVEAPAGYAPMGSQRLMDIGASTRWVTDDASGPFHVGPDGLAVTVNGEMLVRLTNLVAVVGSVQLTPENRRNRGRATDQPFGTGAGQMQRATGHGMLYLESGKSQFHSVDLDDEGAYLREERVFAFEEPLAYENGRLSSEAGAVDMVTLKGQGRVLLQLDGPLKAMPIPPGAPMLVPLNRLVGWFGRVTPRLVGFAGQAAAELTGEGYALLGAPAERG